MNYEIKLKAFEGPLDLLLHLIQKNKIDIYDIPMAELTRQYMDYIEESQELNIEVAAEFLVMAAKLLHIKSLTLLPKTKLKSEVDELISTEDPREELVQRLLEYQKFQKVSKELSQMLEKEEKFVKRPPMKLSRKILPPQNLSIHKLLKTFLNAITTNEELILPEVLVSAEIFQVKDKMTSIISRLENFDEIKLSEVVETNSTGEIIATFLALLELVKRHKVTAEQVIPFADILITNIDNREQVNRVE